MSEPKLNARVLVDTGPLVAIFREADQHHAACVQTLASIVPPMLTTWLVMTEAAYLLRKSPVAVQKLVNAPATGLFRILRLEESELPQLGAILKKYQRLGIQMADASLVRLAEREQTGVIFTLDRRDFSVLRGPRNKPFQLLP